MNSVKVVTWETSASAALSVNFHSCVDLESGHGIYLLPRIRPKYLWYEPGPYLATSIIVFDTGDLLASFGRR